MKALNMKTLTPIKTIPLCLLALWLGAGVLTTTARAQALQGQLVMRPLTPQEVKDYGLTGTQSASGLSTVAIGQPAYLDVQINNAVPNANITSVTWVLTNKPPGSLAVLTNSPLGTNVPPYKMADRFNNSGAPVYKVAARAMLRPDLVGQYTIRVTIVTTTSGTTNLNLTLTAATYLGANVCTLCHSGGHITNNVAGPWSQTAHASAFRLAIDGLNTDHFNKNCISCHSVGFDANTNLANGGFNYVAAQTGWVFPTVLTNGNWEAMPAALKNVSNVQCENCHGPGSEHFYYFGDTNRITKSFISGDCAQCHDSLTHHPKTTEWNNSKHAVATRTPSGTAAGRNNCVRCHTAMGFEQFIEHAGNPAAYVTNTTYEAITCAACHDPHDAANPHQLRAANTYTLPEGTTVTNVGLGALCMTCHHSRNGSATTNIANFQQGKPTWAGGSSFGPHDSTAGDMVEGVNAITYGQIIPSGAHSYTVTNVCVGCHMQPVAAGEPGFGQAGGHSFSMTYNFMTNGLSTVVDKVDVCVKCHGPIEGFDMVRKDYNGDGVIEGIQTEVQKLLDRLSTMLPNSTYRADGNYVADGLVKTSISAKTNWPVRFLNAAWNWQFVKVEGSKGIHNAPYTIGVLKASIADLTGDSNNDGLPDAWQIQYFGSANHPNAAPNAAPAGDGIPNWLKYALELNPMIPGLVVPNGVVWANNTGIGGGTNTIHIYTAAEVVFDTEVGKTYQIQAVSNLGGGWQNIGAGIPGTGTAISYVTPTRSPAQQFYRVVHTP